MDLKLEMLEPEASWDVDRLKDILRTRFPQLGSRGIGLAVKNGLVRRGNVVLDDLFMIPGVAGGAIQVDLRHGVHGEGKPKRPPLIDRMKVLFEDEHLVVVEKSAGVVVQPEEKSEGENQAGPPLVEMLMHYWRIHHQPVVNPILIQRLDAETSGLMVLAKKIPTARILQQDLAARQVQRIYQALVVGKVGPDQGRWRTFLGQGPDGMKQSVHKGAGAQEAITHFHVIRRLPRITHLELKLETGRTHQIRIHTAESGHPVLGDVVYRKLAARVWKRAQEGRLATSVSRDHPYSELLRLLESSLPNSLPSSLPSSLPNSHPNPLPRSLSSTKDALISQKDKIHDSGRGRDRQEHPSHSIKSEASLPSSSSDHVLPPPFLSLRGLDSYGLCLHAVDLVFTHPITGERLEFHSNLPDRMERILRKERGR